MLAYNFNEQGFFISKQEAKKDPLESIKEGKDIFLLPKNSTFKKPLKEKEGFSVIYESDTWIYKEIPKPPKPKEPTLIELKEVKINEITQQKNKELYSLIDFKGTKFINSQISSSNMVGEFIEAKESSLINWMDYKGVLIVLTKTELSALMGLIRNQRRQAYFKEAELIKKVSISSTIEEVNNIILN